MKAKRDKLDWKEARMEVIRNTEDMGWFQAPRNVAFTMIGWLYGEGDFGKSICIAVNCGDDTDCTGATLGSILGIIGGTKAIPEKWRSPVGDKITNVAINGFTAPSNLGVLTDSTVSMTKRVQRRNNFPVIVGHHKTDLKISKSLLKPDRQELEKTWNRSPWRVARHNAGWVLILDYKEEPYISQNEERKMTFSVSNVSGKKEVYRLNVSALPDKWNLSGLPADTFGIEIGGKKVFDLSFLTSIVPPDTSRMTLKLECGTDADFIPVTLFRMQ
jgi:hypothetical protein